MGRLATFVVPSNGCHTPRKRGIQYAAASRLITSVSGILDHPLSRVMTTITNPFAGSAINRKKMRRKNTERTIFQTVILLLPPNRQTKSCIVDTVHVNRMKWRNIYAQSPDHCDARRLHEHADDRRIRAGQKL